MQQTNLLYIARDEVADAQIVQDYFKKIYGHYYILVTVLSFMVMDWLTLLPADRLLCVLYLFHLFYDKNGIRCVRRRNSGKGTRISRTVWYRLVSLHLEETVLLL